MRLIVYGGRNYHDWVAFLRAMERYRGMEGALTIIHGDATGADNMADRWAAIYRANCMRFPAAWKDLSAPGAFIKIGKHGPYNANAGFARNQDMIDHGRPDRGLEFPGGPGTADMRERLIKAGIPYSEAYPVASLFD